MGANSNQAGGIIFANTAERAGVFEIFIDKRGVISCFNEFIVLLLSYVSLIM